MVAAFSDGLGLRRRAGWCSAWVGGDGREVRGLSITACGNQVQELRRSQGHMRRVLPGEARDGDGDCTYVLVVVEGVWWGDGVEDGVYTTIEIRAGCLGPVMASVGATETSLRRS